MYTASALKATAAYRSVDTYSGVAGADPHRLIEMLLTGALDKIAAVKGHLARGDISAKGMTVGKVIAILDGLRSSLDKKAGGKLAQDLDDLYDYMQRQLVMANARNDAAVLDEVASLLATLKDAWVAIRP